MAAPFPPSKHQSGASSLDITISSPPLFTNPISAHKNISMNPSGGGPNAGALDPSRAPQFLDMMLRRNRIVMVSATYCQFCTKLKMLLIELKHRFVSLEIDIIPNGREVFTEVVSRTGVHTVPQVFLAGKFIGGYDDLVSLYKLGELTKILERG